MDVNKAFSAENGVIIDEQNGGPFYTGGAASPVGLDLPTGTFYLQSTVSGVLIWRKFGALVTDWRQLSAQDIPISAIVGSAATEVQTALEDSMNYNAVASASGNTTTTSATDVLIADMSLVAPVNGKYLVNFNTSLSYSTNNAAAFLSVYVGGVLVSNASVKFDRKNVNLIIPVAISGVVLTASGDDAARTIDVRWRVSAGTLTANDFRYISIVKVGPV